MRACEASSPACVSQQQQLQQQEQQPTQPGPPPRMRLEEEAEGSGYTAAAARGLHAKQAVEEVGRGLQKSGGAARRPQGAPSRALHEEAFPLSLEARLNRETERGASSCSRAGSAATRATRGSEAADLSSDMEEGSIRHPSAGYQSWYGGLIGLVFKHWVHTTCCETEVDATTPLNSKTFQEGSSANPPMLLRRSSRSRTLAACSLQHESLHLQQPAASASSSSAFSPGGGRRRRSHAEGNTEKLLSEIAAQVESEELFYGCDDVPFETQTERAVLALALQTPRNKKDGRGVWLLRHQHQHHIQQLNSGQPGAYSSSLRKVSEAAEGGEPAPPPACSFPRKQKEQRLPARGEQGKRTDLSAALLRGLSAPPANESEAAFHSPASYAGGGEAPHEKSLHAGAVLKSPEGQTEKRQNTDSNKTHNYPQQTQQQQQETHQQQQQLQQQHQQQQRQQRRQKLEGIPRYTGELSKAPPSVDPETRIDCSKITNLEIELLCDPPPPLLTHARLLSRLLVGKWETVLTRSDPLESLFRAFGIAYFKRVVVDKLAIPLDITLEEEDTVLHVVLTIPLGLRHMRMTLDGSPSVDEDPDCGTWEGVVQIGPHSQPWFDNGRPFPALQQRRQHKKIGEVLETRAVLPDATYGRVMIMQFHLFGKKGKPDIVCNRLLKPVDA
ncbi:hypothetical protein Efla_005243 [Eimeria flavescens]